MTRPIASEPRNFLALVQSDRGCATAALTTACEAHESNFLGSHRRFCWFGAALFDLWLALLAPEQPWFPVGTLAVNPLGCLAIGFLGGIAEGRRIFDPEIRLLVFVGNLGGFTTFSAFAYETASLAHEARLAAALLNIALASRRGLLAVWLGGLMARFT
jgi:protein CrcB